MNTLLRAALAMSGIFVVCYPIMMFLLNTIMNKIESKGTV